MENIRNEAAVVTRDIGLSGGNLKLPKRKADVCADARHDKGWRYVNERDRLEEKDMDGWTVLV